MKKCMNAVYSVDDNKIPIVVGELSNPVLYGACQMAIKGITREVTHSRRDILELLGRSLGDHDQRVLDELARNGAAPIDKHPGDYHKARLRTLRNHGLIQTDGL